MSAVTGSPLPRPGEGAFGKERIRVLYEVQAAAGQIEAVAQAIAVEQSVELPLAAITDQRVLDHTVGQIHSIRPLGDASGASEGDGIVHAWVDHSPLGRRGLDRYEVAIDLALDTMGLAGSASRALDIAQMMNMLFGNTSLHAHVQLVDVEWPECLTGTFAGPRFGLEGIRDHTGARGRALTCAALKPQGLPIEVLAKLCHTFALAGIDIIKDDHGLSDQAYSPFAERVRACQGALDKVRDAMGVRTIYAPSLTGSPRRLIEQARIAEDTGCAMVMMAPSLIGLPVFAEMVADHISVPVLAHPSMGGAARIAPPLLFGSLFRLLGADASIFVNHGGRFAYSRGQSLLIAEHARKPLLGTRAALPVPAGGMTVERVPEMLNDYGENVMLLIGGSLLIAREDLLERTRAFVHSVHAHGRA